MLASVKMYKTLLVLEPHDPWSGLEHLVRDRILVERLQSVEAQLVDESPSRSPKQLTDLLQSPTFP